MPNFEKYRRSIESPLDRNKDEKEKVMDVVVPVIPENTEDVGNTSSSPSYVPVIGEKTDKNSRSKQIGRKRASGRKGTGSERKGKSFSEEQPECRRHIVIGSDVLNMVKHCIIERALQEDRTLSIGEYVTECIIYYVKRNEKDIYDKYKDKI